MNGVSKGSLFGPSIIIECCATDRAEWYIESYICNIFEIILLVI